MGCHGVAQQFGGDFSFVAAKAGIGKPVDTVAPSDLSAEELARHNHIINLRRANYLFNKNKDKDR